MRASAPVGRVIFCFGCVVLGGVQSLSAAINITGYSPAVNDRFANDASFIGADYDFSGVARADDGRWVSMISPTAFVSAYHWEPATGTDVTFYESNDPLGNQFTSSIRSTQRVGGTDIVVGFLDSALPNTYAYYDIFDGALSGGAAGQLYNYPIPNITTYMLGISPTDYGDVSLNMSIGLNELEAYIPQATVASSTADAVVTFQDSSPSAYEAQLAVGDSGGPAFAMIDGVPTIVGVNWFTATFGDGTELSAMSYLPNYADEVDGILSASAVPEPAALGLYCGLLALGCARFKRRSSG